MTLKEAAEADFDAELVRLHIEMNALIARYGLGDLKDEIVESFVNAHGNFELTFKSFHAITEMFKVFLGGIVWAIERNPKAKLSNVPNVQARLEEAFAIFQSV